MKTKNILFFALLFYIPVNAQIENPDYTLTTEIGIGYSRYLTDMKFDRLNKNGFNGSIRFMWNPEHLLSIGLETGYQYLYSIDVEKLDTEFGSTNFSASMYAIPIYLVAAMKITERIKIVGGTGTYLLYNSGDFLGENIESSQISIGYHTGLIYTQPLSRDFSMGGEIKYSYVSKIQDQVLIFRVLIVYNLLRW